MLYKLLNNLVILQQFLEGKKTHIIAAVMLVLNLAVALNMISPAHLVQINVVLGALGLSALRAAVQKA